MERRLKLLAEKSVRNIDQYNKKVRQLQAQPRVNRRIFLFAGYRPTKASAREPGVYVALSFLQFRLPVEHDRDRTGRRIEALRIY